MLPKRPIFIVEVDKKFPSESLEELLLLMKQLGDDSKLVKPIVVLSSSRSALGLNIGIRKLAGSFELGSHLVLLLVGTMESNPYYKQVYT